MNQRCHGEGMKLAFGTYSTMSSSRLLLLGAPPPSRCDSASAIANTSTGQPPSGLKAAPSRPSTSCSKHHSSQDQYILCKIHRAATQLLGMLRPAGPPNPAHKGWDWEQMLILACCLLWSLCCNGAATCELKMLCSASRCWHGSRNRHLLVACTSHRSSARSGASSSSASLSRHSESNAAFGICNKSIVHGLPVACASHRCLAH